MENKKKKKVVLFSKKKFGLEQIVLFLETNFTQADIYIGTVGEDFPLNNIDEKYDICISYMSPWIIPDNFLKQINDFSINFHPGSPDYRGIGCTNFAIYNKEKEYGVTVHLMEEKVDTGKIIDVKRFPILKSETLYSLTQKCYVYILNQFFDIFNYYIINEKLPETNETWNNKLYTRKELNKLCELDINMSIEEINLRVKSTNFPNMPGAFFKIGNNKFKLEQKNV